MVPVLGEPADALNCVAHGLGGEFANAGLACLSIVPPLEPIAKATKLGRATRAASSAAQGARLRTHLRLLEEYGAGGFRELADGRFRYYDKLVPATKSGEMTGARLVREWNRASGNMRTWYETLDHAGRIRQIHPYQPYSQYHYMFDEFGNYTDRR